jgi:hypothetical protein
MRIGLKTAEAPPAVTVATAALALAGLAAAAAAAGCFDDSRLDPYRCKAASDCTTAPGCATGGCACADGLCVVPKATDAGNGPSDSGAGAVDSGAGAVDSGTALDSGGGAGCAGPGDCTDPTLPVCANMSCAPCSADPPQCATIDPTRPLCDTDGQCVECLNSGDCGGMGMQCVGGTCM